MQTVGIILLIMVAMSIFLYYWLFRLKLKNEEIEVVVTKSPEGLFKFRIQKGKKRKYASFNIKRGEFEKMAEMEGCHFIVQKGTKKLFLFLQGELLVFDPVEKEFVPVD